ncbi:glycosyltransferase [bacterium]|nr:glycosyltransferase [bacterium]
MRICHLGKFYHPHSGGIESHVRTLAQAQAAKGHDVSVACIAHDSKLPNRTVDGLVKVQRFQPRMSVAKFDWLPNVKRYLEQSEPDILHLHLPNPSMTIPVLAMKRQIPLVITYHSDVIGMSLRKWLFEPLQRRLMNRAIAIAATNPCLAETSPLLQRYRNKVCSIPLGISLERFITPESAICQRAREIQQQVAGPLWLMCGRLVHYKGHEIALRALKTTPGTLVIIGDGPLKASLQSLSREWNLTDRVQFLGHVPDDRDVHAWYLAATALWLPSILQSEAFGLVQVEAMASGCPVINTDIPGSGVPWVSQHELTGITIPIGDPEALRTASLRILTEEGLRERLAMNGMIRARSEFSVETMVDRVDAFYSQLPPCTKLESAHVGVSI